MVVLEVETVVAAVAVFEVDTVESSADNVVVFVAEMALSAVAFSPIASFLVVAVFALLRQHLYACDSTSGSSRNSGSPDIQGMQS